MNYQTCVYSLVVSTVQPSFCRSTPNANVLVQSLLNRVSRVPAYQRGLHANVLVCQKACHFFERCSYKILRGISIFCYYILLLYILLLYFVIINLFPVCGKVFERLLYNNMFSFFSENDLISPKQSGFRPGDSCTNQ